MNAMLKFLPRPRSVTSWILVALVVIHTVWILNHLRLHAEGVINPWKGAGYGMYTNLSPSPSFEIFTSDVLPVTKVAANRPGRLETQPLLERNNIRNMNRFFKCRAVTPRYLRVFINRNRNKLKKYVSITIKERTVNPETRAMQRIVSGNLLITIEGGKATYKGIMCDRESETYTVNLRG